MYIIDIRCMKDTVVLDYKYVINKMVKAWGRRKLICFAKNSLPSVDTMSHESHILSLLFMLVLHN